MLHEDTVTSFRQATKISPRDQQTGEVTARPGGPSSSQVSFPDGLRVGSLAPGERVSLRTRNSMYSVVMLQPTEQNILIRGGRHFTHPTEACLLGCSEGQGGLRIGWVAVGLSLELAVGHRRYVTSPVVAIEREEDEAGAA